MLFFLLPFVFLRDKIYSRQGTGSNEQCLEIFLICLVDLPRHGDLDHRPVLVDLVLQPAELGFLLVEFLPVRGLLLAEAVELLAGGFCGRHFWVDLFGVDG